MLGPGEQDIDTVLNPHKTAIALLVTPNKGQNDHLQTKQVAETHTDGIYVNEYLLK